jgi:hypothetical protein
LVLNNCEYDCGGCVGACVRNSNLYNVDSTLEVTDGKPLYFTPVGATPYIALIYSCCKSIISSDDKNCRFCTIGIELSEKHGLIACRPTFIAFSRSVPVNPFGIIAYIVGIIEIVILL